MHLWSAFDRLRFDGALARLAAIATLFGAALASSGCVGVTTLENRSVAGGAGSVEAARTFAPSPRDTNANGHSIVLAGRDLQPLYNALIGMRFVFALNLDPRRQHSPLDDCIPSGLPHVVAPNSILGCGEFGPLPGEWPSPQFAQQILGGGPSGTFMPDLWFQGIPIGTPVLSPAGSPTNVIGSSLSAAALAEFNALRTAVGVTFSTPGGFNRFPGRRGASMGLPGEVDIEITPVTRPVPLGGLVLSDIPSGHQADCGAMGWRASTDALGRPVDSGGRSIDATGHVIDSSGHSTSEVGQPNAFIRIPWLMKIRGISLSVRCTCGAAVGVDPDGGSNNSICSQVCGPILQPAVVSATELSAGCEFDVDYELGIGADMNDEIAMCFNTDLTVASCTNDPLFALAHHIPRCPVVTGDSITGALSPIRLPDVSLTLGTSVNLIRDVDLTSGGAAYRTLGRGGLTVGLPFVLLQCPIAIAGLNANQFVRGIASPLIAGQLGAALSTALTSALPNVSVFSPSALTSMAPLVSPPNCNADFTSFVGAATGSTCGQPGGFLCAGAWANYAIQRTVYRFLSRPFNEANTTLWPAWHWTHWTVADEESFPNVGTFGNLTLDMCQDGAGAPGTQCGPHNAVGTVTAGTTPARINTGIDLNGAPCQANVNNPSACCRLLDDTTDVDADGTPDTFDNCIVVPNRLQHNCNAGTETALNDPSNGGPIVQVLGDACDVRPCAEVTRLAGGRAGGRTTPFLCTARESEPAHLELRAVGINNSGFNLVPPSTSEIVFGQMGSLRCPCLDADGNPADPATCLTPCGLTGSIGPAGSVEGWHSADVGHDASQVDCRFDSENNSSPTMAIPVLRRCAPSVQAFFPEVTNQFGSLALGIRGVESRYLDSRDWFFTTETARADSFPGFGALLPGRTTLDSIANLTINTLPVMFWTRGVGNLAAMDPGTRLSDHFTRPLLLVVGNTAPCPIQGVAAPSWWRFQSQILPFGRANPWGELRGARSVAVMPVPLGGQSAFAQNIVGDRGDLDGSLSALAIGILEPLSGRWSGVGASHGTVPPGVGMAYALGVANDGKPGVFAFGDFVSAIYVGSVTSTAAQTRVDWIRRPISTSGVPIGNPPPITAGPPPAAGPSPRTHAAFTASPDGRTLFVFGGRGAHGVLNDLWQYDVLRDVWALIATPSIAPREGAAIAADGIEVVILGGRDDKGEILDDLAVVRTDSPIALQFGSTGVHRVDSALAIDQDRVLAYGGTSDSGPTGDIVAIGLTNGYVVQTASTGIPTSAGAAIAADDSGTIYAIAGNVSAPQFNGTVFAGMLASLQGVAPGVMHGGRETCHGGQSDARVGSPCQSSDDWRAQPGSIACANSGTSCAASIVAGEVGWRLDGVDAFALAGNIVAAVGGNVLSAYVVADGVSPTLIASGQLSEVPRAIAMSRDVIVVASASALSSIPVESGSLVTASTIDTCGEVRALTTAGSIVYADTTAGVETFALRDGHLALVAIDVIRTGERNDHDGHGGARFDASTLGVEACRAIRGAICEMRGVRCGGRHAIEVTADGRVWVVRDNDVVALALPVGGRESTVGARRIGDSPLSVRAIENVLAVLGADDRNMLTETLVVQSARGGAGESNDDGERERGESGLSIVNLGRHGLSSWLTQRPQHAGSWLIRLVAGHLEGADANAR